MNNILRVVSLALLTVILLASVPAQSQRQQKAAATGGNQTAAATSLGNTPGRIVTFTTSKAVGNSNLTEDAANNIGIDTTQPTSRRQKKQLRQRAEQGRQPRK